jgi:aspartokinase
VQKQFDKIKIGGVKISDKLLRICVVLPVNLSSETSRIFRILAEEKIPMLFLTIDRKGGDISTSCCVDLEHEDRARVLIESDSVLKDHARFTPDVVLLSMFPHQSQLVVFGVSLHALGKANLPILDFSSSLAALSFVLKYKHLKRALTALSEFFVFPTDPAYLKSAVRVRQA